MGSGSMMEVNTFSSKRFNRNPTRATTVFCVVLAGTVPVSPWGLALCMCPDAQSAVIVASSEDCCGRFALETLADETDAVVGEDSADGCRDVRTRDPLDHYADSVGLHSLRDADGGWAQLAFAPVLLPRSADSAPCVGARTPTFHGARFSPVLLI